MKKITAPQLIFLLFFTRGFLSITYEASQFRPDGTTVMLSAAISVAIQFLLVLPVLAAAKKFPHRDIIQLSFERSAVAGKFISLLFLCYFAFETVHVLGNFSYFLKNHFFEAYHEAFLMAALAVTAFYAATLGFSAVARASSVSAVIFITALVVIVFAVTGEFDVYNLHMPIADEKELFGSVLREVGDSLGRSVELAALIFLLPHVENRRTAGLFSYLGIKLLFVEFSTLMITAVLGDYAKGLTLPLYTLSTYARSSVIERFDSVYMLVWTIAVFLKVALLLMLGGQCLKNIFPKLNENISKGLVTAAAAATAISLAALDRWDSLLFRSPSAPASLILGFLIPLAVLLFCRRKTERS